MSDAIVEAGSGEVHSQTRVTGGYEARPGGAAHKDSETVGCSRQRAIPPTPDELTNFTELVSFALLGIPGLEAVDSQAAAALLRRWARRRGAEYRVTVCQAQEVLARVVWSVIVEPGDEVAGTLVACLGAARALRHCWCAAGDEPAMQRAADMIEDALVHGVSGVSGVVKDSSSLTQLRRRIRKAVERWAPRMKPAAARGVLALAVLSDMYQLVVPGDTEWPTGFADLGTAEPLLLWVRGQLSVLVSSHESAAIVGARAATGYGTHVATELGAGLAERGIPVISGGAYGIDGAAHRAVLAADGLTVAVLAGGLDRLYPSGHAELLVRICKTGALISEVPFGTAPTGWRFLARNRLIAAMSSATVVVEAGARSGSLNTASHAMRLLRPLAAVPGPVTSPASAGCLYLLREAQAVCVATASHVAELTRTHLDVENPPPAVTDSRDEDMQRRVLRGLSQRTARTSAEVAERCGLSLRETTEILGLLVLEDRVIRDSLGWRQLSTAQSQRKGLV